MTSREALAKAVQAAFPESVGAVDDVFIEEHPDLMSISLSGGLMQLVPAYMTWCLRNQESSFTLVPDYTVNALAEFGRHKSANTLHLNFKHLCTAEQRAVVVQFLEWGLSPEQILDTEQIERALKHWR
jgi:hypothetical protein